jgi:hypothetical protein
MDVMTKISFRQTKGETERRDVESEKVQKWEKQRTWPIVQLRLDRAPEQREGKTKIWDGKEEKIETEK